MTKRKESEQYASSIYNGEDLTQPLVNFQDFLDDDENIVDEVSREFSRQWVLGNRAFTAFDLQCTCMKITIADIDLARPDAVGN